MRGWGLVRAVMLCAVWGAAAAVCAAQAYTPPPPPLTTLPPCPTGKDGKKLAKEKKCDPTVYPPETVEAKRKKTVDGPAVEASPAAPANAATPPDAKPAAERFPFPGEQPMPSPNAAKQFPYSDSGSGSYSGESMPHDPEAEKKASETTAAKSYPYPGEAAPDVPPAAAPKPDASASESSSSSSSSGEETVAGDAGGGAKSASAKNPDDDDEDQPKLKDKGSEGRRSKKVVKPQTDTERVDEDLSVAKFYGQSGNFMGAYLRAKDAVATQPEYPEGHFALGEAAKRLKKKDEAVAEFQAYLKLAPDGDKAKAAEKALDELR